MKVAERQINL